METQYTAFWGEVECDEAAKGRKTSPAERKAIGQEFRSESCPPEYRSHQDGCDCHYCDPA